MTKKLGRAVALAGFAVTTAGMPNFYGESTQDHQRRAYRLHARSVISIELPRQHIWGRGSMECDLQG